MLPTKYLTWALLTLGLSTAMTDAYGAAPSLDGIYKLDAKASDNIDTALEAAFTSAESGVQFEAVAFLRKRHPAYSQTKIAHDTNEVVVTFDDGNPMRTPISGAVVPWIREDGKPLEIKSTWTTTKLVQTINTQDTVRVNEFLLSSDGSTLTIKVDFTGYPKPLKYQLVYRRDTTS